MEHSAIVIAFIIFVYLIRVIFIKVYIPKIKGAKGEYRVKRRLRKLNKKEYVVFNDFYLKTNEIITQIDHLVVSVYGIFVIETKNYNGWIHGNEKAEYWTQSFYKKKTKFRNPIKQNWSHIYALKKVLSNFYGIKYHPIIVFTSKAKLKNVYSENPVIYDNKLIKTIKQKRTPYFSTEQVSDIIKQLNKFIVKDGKVKKEHRKYIQRKIAERESNVGSLICPNCGGYLVVREGKFGAFYGCSNFPKCKFSKKL